MKRNPKIQSNWLLNINLFFLAIIVFLLSINQQIIAPFIGLWGVSSIGLIIKDKLKFRLNLTLLSLMAFYLFLVLGLLWTDNMNAGVFDLEVKMSIFIFPFFMSFIVYNRKQLRIVFWSLIFGIFVGMGILIFKAIPNYNETSNIDVFFYAYLSQRIHPSYFSYYLIVSIITLYIDLRFKIIDLFKYRWIYLLLILTIFCLNILLLSKIGVIVSCLILLFFTITEMVRKKKFLQGMTILVCLTCLLFISFKKSSYVEQRVSEFVASIDNAESSNSSTGIRIQIWEQGLTIVKSELFIGHGTGDVKDVLVESYTNAGMIVASEKKLNAHSQYLQVAISIGVLGLLIFVSSFYFGLKTGSTHGNYYLIGFILVTLLFLFPESMLENQAGTIAFGLFFSLFNQKSLSNEIS